jgi:hypothetical protein
MANNSPAANALEALLIAAQHVVDNRVPEHPRITSTALAREIATALGEFLASIDATLDAGLPQQAMEDYPLFTAITWIPPTVEGVATGQVGASFSLSTMVGPRFRVVVIPELITERINATDEELAAARARFARQNNGIGAT